MLIYVSGPYSADTDAGIAANIERARRVAIQLWEWGHSVICPHLNTAHFERDCQARYQDYLNGDLTMVERCDALVMLDGWTYSNGAFAEHDHASNLGIPVYYQGTDLSMLRLDVPAPDSTPAERLAPMPSDGDSVSVAADADPDVVTLASGARQSKVHGRYDCLPGLGVHRAALAAELGLNRHGRDNWRKGIPVFDHVNHALAHLYAFLEGDTREDHLGHAAWRALAAAHVDEAEHRADVVDARVTR